MTKTDQDRRRAKHEMIEGLRISAAAKNPQYASDQWNGPDGLLQMIVDHGLTGRDALVRAYELGIEVGKDMGR